MTARLSWVSLTIRFLLSSSSWPFTTVRWISETMIWVFVAFRSSSEAMARTSRRMSEMVPCVLTGKGCDDSPGALDAKVRCWSRLQPRSLTWHEPGKGWMITQRRVEYERYSPSDSDHAYPRAFSTRYDDCREQWRGRLQRHSGRRERWCGCS